jgi:hypothetical protein
MSVPTNIRLPADASADLPPLSAGLKQASRNPRALRILAKTIYRELRQGGLAEEDVMSLAGELLSLVTCEMKDRRRNQSEGGDQQPSTSAARPAVSSSSNPPPLER